MTTWTIVAAMLAAAVGLTAPTDSEAYAVVTVRDGGTLRGKVTFQGTPPPARKLSITKDVEVCGGGPSERHEVRVNGSGLRDVVVTLQQIKEGKAWPTTAPKPLDQQKCVFLPYLQVIHPGAGLPVVNSDPVLHNLRPFELSGTTRRSLFNLAQPKQGERIVKTITPRTSEVIRLECDAHNWMLGWLYVPNNPYYALVGDDGSFAIDQVPPGTYKVRAWHPTLGTQEREITVGAKGQAQIAFTFGAR